MENENLEFLNNLDKEELIEILDHLMKKDPELKKEIIVFYAQNDPQNIKYLIESAIEGLRDEFGSLNEESEDRIYKISNALLDKARKMQENEKADKAAEIGFIIASVMEKELQFDFNDESLIEKTLIDSFDFLRNLSEDNYSNETADLIAHKSHAYDQAFEGGQHENIWYEIKAMLLRQ